MAPPYELTRMSLDSELNLWRNTIGYGCGAMPRIGYLTREQNLRLERISCCRKLYRGDHAQFFLWEGRTHHNFPEVRVQGVPRRLYQTYNLLRLITLKSADLLLGERPGVNAQDAAQQEAIDALAKRTRLHKILYTAVKEASWSAEATVEIVRWDGDVFVTNLAPGEVCPIGPVQPNGQHASYARFAVQNVGTDEKPAWLRLETTYTSGLITRKCFRMSAATENGTQVDLAIWPVEENSGGAMNRTLQEREETGIDSNTIVWLANEDEEGQAVSDYDGLIAAQDLVNAKRTQIARVLAKHSDPKMAIPERMAQPNGTVPSDHSAFYYGTKEEIPEYIIWNAELASADVDFKNAIHELCIQAEMSEVLLGIADDAAVQTATGYRLKATNSVSKAKRKGINVTPFVERIVDVCQEMEDALRIVSVAVSPVGVEMRDGLPQDDYQQAQTISLLTGGKPTMSVERAVEMQIPDPEARAAELARLEKAAADVVAAATPNILLANDAVPAQTPEGGDMGETPMPQAA